MVKKYETLISIIYSVEAPPSESEQSQIEEGIEEDESENEKSLDHSSGRIFFQSLIKIVVVVPVVLYLSIFKEKNYLAPFLEIKNNVDKLTVEILHVINILTYYKNTKNLKKYSNFL